MERDRVARGIASTVPQLLTVQVQTAHRDTSEAVALALERMAEELLSWHDRVAVGTDHLAMPHREHQDHRAQSAAPSTATDQKTTALRASIERGVIPGSPRTLQLAASELHNLRRTIEAITEGQSEVHDDRSTRTLAHCAELADALGRHEDVLRHETDRLRSAATAAQRVQVYARVVRAERSLMRAAMTTLAP